MSLRYWTEVLGVPTLFKRDQQGNDPTDVEVERLTSPWPTYRQSLPRTSSVL